MAVDNETTPRLTPHEVLASWADHARAPLRGTTCDDIARGIATFLEEAGYIIIPREASNGKT